MIYEGYFKFEYIQRDHTKVYLDQNKWFYGS